MIAVDYRYMPGSYGTCTAVLNDFRLGSWYIDLILVNNLWFVNTLYIVVFIIYKQTVIGVINCLQAIDGEASLRAYENERNSKYGGLSGL